MKQVFWIILMFIFSSIYSCRTKNSDPTGNQPDANTNDDNDEDEISDDEDEEDDEDKFEPYLFYGEASQYESISCYKTNDTHEKSGFFKMFINFEKKTDSNQVETFKMIITEKFFKDDKCNNSDEETSTKIEGISKDEIEALEGPRRNTNPTEDFLKNFNAETKEITLNKITHGKGGLGFLWAKEDPIMKNGEKLYLKHLINFKHKKVFFKNHLYLRYSKKNKQLVKTKNDYDLNLKDNQLKYDVLGPSEPVN